MALVAGKLRAHPNNAVFAAVGSGVLGRGELALAFGFALEAKALVVQMQTLRLEVRTWPGGVADPTTADVTHACTRRLYVHDVSAKRGVFFYTRVLVFQPPIPPSQRLL